MKPDMNIIMESWRKNLNEQKAHAIYESLIEEFVNEIRSLQEAKAEINEILSSIKNFAAKAYNTYKDIKTGTIKTVLLTAINSALKFLDIIEGKVPKIAGKLRMILGKLKKSENMTIAVSIVSIIVGLMTGEAFDVLGKILDVVSAAPNLIMAYEQIRAISDTASVGQVIGKSGQLAKKVTQQENKSMNNMKLIMENFRIQTERANTLDKVKDLFSDPKAISDTSRLKIILGNYEPGTYGAFAQTQQILSILKRKNIKIKSETVTAAFETLAGSGGDSTVGKISATVGYALAVAGVLGVLGPKLALATGVAGVGLAAKSLVKAYKGKQKAVERQPELAAFGLDEEFIKLLDDEVENEFFKFYQKLFIKMVEEKPNSKMTHINQVAHWWLKKNYKKRTLVGAPNMTS